MHKFDHCPGATFHGEASMIALLGSELLLRLVFSTPLLAGMIALLGSEPLLVLVSGL